MLNLRRDCDTKKVKVSKFARKLLSRTIDRRPKDKERRRVVLVVEEDREEEEARQDVVDILFPSNHNIHKSLCGGCFLASDPLIERF